MEHDREARNTGSTSSATTTIVGELDVNKVIEAHSKFIGVPSHSLSFYYTGPAWPPAQEILPVFDHKISHVWYELGEKIYRYFDSIQLKWTSIDPVQFAEAGKEAGPLFLWVGVLPGTLTPDHAKEPAAHCKDIMLQYNLTDIEIAFRESVYTRYAGRQLLDPVSPFAPIVDIWNPFTSALGLSIAPRAFPYYRGTGCLYLREGGKSSRIFLLTARHVALPIGEYPSGLYHRKNHRIPRQEIIHFDQKAFQNAVKAIAGSISDWGSVVYIDKIKLARLGEHVEGENPEITEQRQKIEHSLREAEALEASLVELEDITRSWKGPKRVLGHVVYSPPVSISTGEGRYTEDWALIELSRKKIAWSTFRGNVIHYGKLLSQKNLEKMYPNAETCAQFKAPANGLLQLHDFVRYDELRRPTMLDTNGGKCLIVIKNGAQTGITLGRATGIESFVRVYKKLDIDSTSMEIAIYSYYGEDGIPFSAGGDSGSVVADINGRIVGMITGGTDGQTASTDITYVTPYYFLDECIKKAFPRSHLFPIRNMT